MALNSPGRRRVVNVIMRTRFLLIGLIATASWAAQAPAGEDAWTKALARLEAGDVAGAKSLALPPGAPLPASGRGLYVLGRIQLEEDQIDAALASLEKAADEMPRDADVLYWHGIACNEKVEAKGTGKLTQLSLARKMKSDWTKAVEIAPAHVAAREALIEFYAKAPGIAGGDRDEAYAQARELAKHDACRGALTLGDLMLGDDKADDAIAQIERAAKQCPEMKGIWTRLASVQIAVGRYPAGRASLAEALRRDPADVVALYQLGKYGALTGLELDAAASALETFCAKVPASDQSVAPAHWRLGLVRQKQGDLARARAEYELALKLNPKLEEAKRALRELPAGAPAAKGG